MSVVALSERPKSISRPGAYRMLDAWRGIAALWVVMIHSCLPTIATDSPDLARVPLYAFSLWGQLGVDMFFVISGYCITAALDSAGRKVNPVWYFLRARLRRIYPPYFASMAIAVCLSLLFAFLAAHHLMPKIHHPTPFLGQHFLFYFAALTLTQLPLGQTLIVPVYWSLCYELSFYVLVALCLAALGGNSRVRVYTGLNILTLGSLIWLIVAPKTCPFPLNLWYQFGLGGLVYMLISHPHDRSVRIYFVASIALAMVAACLHIGPHVMGHPSTRIQNLFSVTFALTLLGLYRVDSKITSNKVVKMLERLGVFSYSLYLTHYFVIPIPQQIAKRLGFQGGHYWVSFLAQIATAIAVAALFHKYFEAPFLSSRAKTREFLIESDEKPPIGSNGEERKTSAVPAVERLS